MYVLVLALFQVGFCELCLCIEFVIAGTCVALQVYGQQWRSCMWLVMHTQPQMAVDPHIRTGISQHSEPHAHNVPCLVAAKLCILMRTLFTHTHHILNNTTTAGNHGME